MNQAAADRMKALVELLNRAAKAYYNQDAEIMSNLEYDRLYDELEALEAETGVVLADSPTQKVGYDVGADADSDADSVRGFEKIDELRKVAHAIPLLSLDKTKDVSKLESFLVDGEGILEWKLDGLTVVLSYENGGLARAVTRGNGVIGEDVTHNARVFRNIPLKVDFSGAFSVRGEAVIPYSDFTRINAELGEAEKYKNPRNLCSGAVRQLDSGVAARRGVRYVAYTVLSSEGVDFDDKKENQLKWLAALGFETVEHRVVTKDDIHESVRRFEAKIPENDIASDGLVLTLNSISYGKSLGVTAKFPRDSIAFKWADEESETTLLDIEWNTSRTGLINPVAIFEPVEIEGTTVERASLHNVSVLRGLELGLGDRITVYKANMIIPQVSGNLTRSDTAAIPGNCPVCGHETVLEAQNEGEFLKCPNPNCRAQLLRGLEHFTSRDAMNVEGLSEQTLEKFIQNGFVANYADIYGLSKYEQEITAMEGFGKKSFDNLMKAIDKSRSAALPNLINALGIPQVGLANAKLLCDYFGRDIEKIMAASAEEMEGTGGLEGIEGFGPVKALAAAEYFADPGNAARIDALKTACALGSAPLPQLLAGLGVGKLSLADMERLCDYYQNDIEKIISARPRENGIEGFGEAVSRAVADYFANAENAALLRELLPLLEISKNADISGGGGNGSSGAGDMPFKGKTFVITGSLEKFKNRADLNALIESLGGKVTGSVSKKTDFLINNDAHSGSSKNKKAVEMGVRVITEEEFEGMAEAVN